MIKKMAKKAGICAVFASFLASCGVANVFADAEIQVTANVEESISLLVSDASKSITFSSVSGSGSFGYTSFSVGASLNVPRRYQISMYSSSSASDATSLSSSSSTIPTLSSTESSVNLTTGAGWTSRNTWGYAIGNSGSLNFNAVGSSSAASILHNYSDSTAAIINNASTNITLGAMVDMNSASGTYTTTLNFVMVAELLYDYNLIFDANGGSGAPDTMTVTNDSNTSHNFTIPSITPVAPANSDNSFIGWSTDPNATEATYVNGDAYTMNASSYITTGKLYAVYGTPVTIASITTMQEMTSAICAATPTPSASDGANTPQYQLTDARDSKIYWVAKLANGECWMTQNLDYDIKTSGNIVALTSDGSATTWSSSYAPQATSTSKFNNSSATGTYSYNPGNLYFLNGSGAKTYLGYDLTNSNYVINNTNLHYHVGNFYQWNAATAGTGGTIIDADAAASICPIGWRLPTSGSYTSNYSFGKLTNAYGITNNANGSSDTALLASPLWFVQAGVVWSGQWDTTDGNNIGEVWSSRECSGSNSGYAYILSFYSSWVRPSYANSNHASMGRNVRCVAI